MSDAGALVSYNRNRWVAYALTGFVAAMLLLAYAAVPLYQVFCQATGYGGTTQVASDNPKGLIAREMTVSFDSNVDNNLPWKVTPSKPITGQIGKVETINFTATNTTNHPVTGQAVFNVSPELSGQYFNKIECFCFTKQTLQPGETVQMPVVFFVDPDLDKDRDLNTVRNITLSYTFYPSDNEG
ncbi:cytochrome c oxidase assembly protein [Devosia sp.]|uniref:cytochrome c oxidase assembly protein n=1 Tax=Devosia sp. TaxID=1871048 RepID=UPI00326786D1